MFRRKGKYATFFIKERRTDKDKYLHVLIYAKATLEEYLENVNCGPHKGRHLMGQWLEVMFYCTPFQNLNIGHHCGFYEMAGKSLGFCQ